MRGIVYEWIYTLLISGCICALILYICPDNKTRSLLESGCACVMLLALISPISGLNLQSYSDLLSVYSTQLYTQEQTLGTNAENFAQRVIAQEYETYILSEAAEKNIFVQAVEVIVVQEDDCWLPYEIIYTADCDVSDSFKNYMREQLGVPKERQSTNEAAKSN